MKILHLFQPHVVSLSIVLLAIESIVLTTQPATAQLPTGSGRPAQSNHSGGVRASFCGEDAIDPPLSAVHGSSSVVKTTEERPGILVYIPETTAREVLITLVDQEDNYLYHTQLPILETPGVSNFVLPEDAPVLDLDRPYKWSLAVICDDTPHPGDPMISGWIQQVAPNSALVD